MNWINAKEQLPTKKGFYLVKYKVEGRGEGGLTYYRVKPAFFEFSKFDGDYKFIVMDSDEDGTLFWGTLTIDYVDEPYSESIEAWAYLPEV